MTAAPLTPNGWLRWDVVQPLLDSLGSMESVVEVGCGEGAIATRLAPRARRFVAFEPDAASATVAARRLEAFPHARVLQEKVPEVPEEPAELADLVCAFEVLEHQQDDRAALRAWARHIRPGGHLLLSVPAGPERMGPWDDRVGHYRRYSRQTLTETLHSSGFERVAISLYGFPVGYLLEAVRNAIAKRMKETRTEAATARSGRLLQPGAVTGLLVALAVLPFRYLQRPWAHTELGTGLVALARRRG